MTFDFFNQALTIIAAFPAAVIISPFVNLDEDLPREKKLPLIVLSFLSIFIVFFVLHGFVHMQFTYPWWITILEIAIVVVVCLKVLVRPKGEFKARSINALARHFLCYCIVAGVAIAAVANVLVLANSVVIRFNDGNFEKMKLLRDGETAIVMPLHHSWVGDDYLVLPVDQAILVTGFEAVGEFGEGSFPAIDEISRYSFQGFVVDMQASAD